MSTNNILSPSSGKPIIVPSKDIVLGIYYLTMEVDGLPNEGHLYSDLSEIQYALENKYVTYHTKIKTRIPYYNDDNIITLDYGEGEDVIDLLDKQSPASIRGAGDKSCRKNQREEFFLIPQGEVYGFMTKDGHMYLDENVIKPEHPIHEYTHLGIGL